jgi:hypothetical protein
MDNDDSGDMIKPSLSVYLSAKNTLPCSARLNQRILEKSGAYIIKTGDEKLFLPMKLGQSCNLLLAAVSCLSQNCILQVIGSPPISKNAVQCTIFL